MNIIWLQSVNSFTEPSGIFVNTQLIWVISKCSRQVLTLTPLRLIVNFCILSLEVKLSLENGLSVAQYEDEFNLFASISLNDNIVFTEPKFR